MAEVYRAKGYRAHERSHSHAHDDGHEREGMQQAPAQNLQQAVVSRHPLAGTGEVTVNGVSIDAASIAREMQHHPAGQPIDAWSAAARALVVRELLLQEARRLGISAVPESDGDGKFETPEDALVRVLVATEINTPEPDEETCLRYYERNRSKFQSSDIYEVHHILYAAAPDDETRRADARAKAVATIEALKAGSVSFADIAGAHSACPSGRSGGNLGQISRGQTVPEFESALAHLPIGVMASEPVETRYGFHVARVDRRIEGRQVPFEMAHARIADWLAERVRLIATRQYISVLAGRAAIIGVDFGADPTPLAQ